MVSNVAEENVVGVSEVKGHLRGDSSVDGGAAACRTGAGDIRLQTVSRNYCPSAVSLPLQTDTQTCVRNAGCDCDQGGCCLQQCHLILDGVWSGDDFGSQQTGDDSGDC